MVILVASFSFMGYLGLWQLLLGIYESIMNKLDFGYLDESAWEQSWRDHYSSKNDHKIAAKPLDIYSYKVLESYQAGVYLAARIKYGDHFKVLVFDGVKLADLKQQKSLDPTISASKSIFAPIAQFENSTDGWTNAMKFCSMLHSERLDLSY